MTAWKSPDDMSPSITWDEVRRVLEAVERRTI
jgi:hypothetical protein